MTRSAREALADLLPAGKYDAERILAKLAEEGWVVVPREPTDAILNAGQEANDAWWERNDDSDLMRCTYLAMLAAIDGKGK